jgi:hypothetical protein
MQFGLIEDGPNFGLIARLAIWFMGLSIFVMIYMLITMRSRYVQMRKLLLSLAEPILAQIRKGGWEPNALTFPDAKDPHFAVYTVALRLELAGRGPIAIIESLNKTIDLVGRRFKQMIHYSRLLGWSVCFVGFLGALSHACSILHATAYFKGVPFNAFAMGIYEAARLLEIALFIGLLWLAGSYFSQSRLSSLSLEVSDRILKAAEERAAQDLNTEKV